MLRELHIAHFALIDEAVVRFEPGLNVLSGETGAGKSLLVGALGLLMGERGGPHLIRKGCDEALVEGRFEISDAATLRRIAELTDAEDPGEDIVLRRVLTATGRSRVSVNGRMVTLAGLKEITTRLIEVQGQREHHSLLNAGAQVEILDAYGALTDRRLEFAESLRSLRAQKVEWKALRDKTEGLRERRDMLQYQERELSEAGLTPGELEDLDRQFAITDNHERIRLALEEAVFKLADGDSAAETLVQDVKGALDEFADLGGPYETIVEHLANANESLRDAVHLIRATAESEAQDEGELERLRERIDELKHLEMKYKMPVDDLIDFLARVRDDLNALEFGGDEIDRLGAAIVKNSRNLLKAGDTLNKARQTAAEGLCRTVMRELKDLALKDMQFSVRILPRAASGEDGLGACTEQGTADVEFMIRPNPGADPQPLAKIASGGELSRILMALQAAVAETTSLPVLVFDEIDANIGARLGQVVASKLRKMSQGRQVICVTHLPQIASAADSHLRVDKSTRRGETHTQVVPMEGKQRIEEIAAMIHGDQKTDITLRQAREMIREAQGRT